jgi:hypothetical protein
MFRLLVLPALLLHLVATRRQERHLMRAMVRPA